MKTVVWKKGWQKHFFPKGILLCAVTKVTGRLCRTVTEGTWQILKQTAPFFLHPINGWRGSEGFRMGKKPSKL